MGLGFSSGGAGRTLRNSETLKSLGKMFSAAELGQGLDNAIKSAMQALEQTGGEMAAKTSGTPATAVSFGGDIEKLLYLSVLRGAVEKASGAVHFNLETQINDLWIKLGQLRQNKSNAKLLKLQEMMSKESQLQQALTSAIRQINLTSQTMLQNLK